MSKKLEILKPYKVTKGNSDGSLSEGDIIWLSENGILNCATAPSGFLMPDELTDSIMDFEESQCDEFEIICGFGFEGIRRKPV